MRHAPHGPLVRTSPGSGGQGTRIPFEPLDVAGVRDGTEERSPPWYPRRASAPGIRPETDASGTVIVLWPLFTAATGFRRSFPGAAWCQGIQAA